MKALLTDRFSFDRIAVDPKANAIFFNGVEKRLEPKLISLLCLFAAQGRDVISRQDITQAVWPDVVVGEESITRAIFALRNALGDDAKQPQYIETIPKKGYRFLADVHMTDDSANESSPVVTRVARGSKQIFAGYFLMVVAFVVGLLVFWFNEKKLDVEISSILPLNKMEGVERDISLNADGTQLLFIHEINQKNDLYSRDLQSAKDVLWVRDEFVKKSPLWIDAKTIAYIRQHGGEMQVVRNYQGQSPQVLYTSSNPILQLTMAKGDSENIFFLEFQNNDLIELKSLNLRNGNQQNWRNAIPDLPKKISQLQGSTKANTLLAVINAHESPTIISLDLTTKAVMPFNNQFIEINKITAINDHSLLVVGSLGAAEGIWFVADQQKPQLVLRKSGSEAIVDAQIDLKRNLIFYANLQKNIDVKMISTRHQDVQYLPELNSSGMDVSATFVNDNKHIYFMSNRTGFYDIWRYDRESKSVKQISTLNALSMTWYSLSHDGKKLAVGYRLDDLYLGVVDVETGRLQHQAKTPSHRHPLAWSFDDKSIYASEHQAEVNLFRYDAKTLKPSLFAEKSGLYVKSLDEKSVIYIDYRRHGLVERNLNSQQEKILHDTIPELASLSPGKIKLTQANDGFYTSCQIEWVNKTCLYSLSSTKSSPLVVSDTPFWSFFDITENGDTILAEDVKPSSGDIMKMQLRD